MPNIFAPLTPYSGIENAMLCMRPKRYINIVHTTGKLIKIWSSEIFMVCAIIMRIVSTDKVRNMDETRKPKLPINRCNL